MCIKVIKNPVGDVAESVLNAVKKNDGYCPCKIDRTQETKCMCREFREQVKSGVLGECHCGLYTAVEVEEYAKEEK